MIKLANEKHLNGILNIEKMAFSQPWTRIQLKKDIISSTNAENWVYIEAQQVIGYILGWKVLDEFQLNNIAVHKDWQRRYIGRSLIEHLCVSLHNQGFKRIYLEVSWKNKPAQHLYVCMGFKQFGLRKDYYAKRDHALLFHLNLVDND